MNLVDTSGWLEYFGNHPNAGFFAPIIERTDELIVPSIAIYEVYKKALRVSSATAADMAVGTMRRGIVIPLDERMACFAAETALAESLAMADAIILATARMHRAELWTQDADFAKIPGVRYKARKVPKK